MGVQLDRPDRRAALPCRRDEVGCSQHGAEYNGLPEPRRLTLLVPRVATGERMRVLPGLMGEVLSVNEKNHTIVSVDIDRAEAYARRVMKAQEPTHG